MRDAQRLVDEVRQRLVDTPYVVQESSEGFDVSLNLVDARWYAIAYEERLERTFVHHVALDEQTSTMRITDDARTLTWRAGVQDADGVPRPVLGGSVQRSLGRLHERSFKKVWAVDESGRFDKVVDYSFDAAEGRRPIRAAADELGWQEKAGAAQRIGVVVALASVLLAVVVALVVLVVLL